MLAALKRHLARKATGTVKAKAATSQFSEAAERFLAKATAHAAQVKAEAAAPSAPKEKLAPGWQRTSMHFIEKRST